MKTGIYFGSCHNKTADLDGKLALMIESVVGNTVFGTLGIYGDLLGGSPFRGQLFGESFEFQTVDPKHPVTIIWKGSLVDGAIKGDYAATINKWLYKLIGFDNQQGIWDCELAQSASDTVLAGADDSHVNIRFQTSKEGPLAFPYFVDRMLQGSWTRDAEFQIDGRDEWIPIGMIQDAFAAVLPRGASDKSMIRGIGSEATKKVIGGIIAALVLPLIGFDSD